MDNMTSSKQQLIIITPDQRREVIKVSPDTFPLQVLENACQKYQLDHNSYELKHCNHSVDLSNPIRFSGLPNNADLEIALLERPRKELPVSVVLQTESGKRLKSDFCSSINLWHILEFWKIKGELEDFEASDLGKDDDDLEPTFIYLRQTIIGNKELKKTTLRSLGLTAGSVCLRYVQRPRDLSKSKEFDETALQGSCKKVAETPRSPSPYASFQLHFHGNVSSESEEEKIVDVVSEVDSNSNDSTSISARIENSDSCSICGQMQSMMIDNSADQLDYSKRRRVEVVENGQRHCFSLTGPFRRDSSEEIDQVGNNFKVLEVSSDDNDEDPAPASIFRHKIPTRKNSIPPSDK